MNEFNIKRVVLTEKKLKSTNQIITFLECELSESFLYEYRHGEVFFYIKNDIVLAEFHIHKNNLLSFFVSPIMFFGFDKKEIEFRLEKIILQNFLQIEKTFIKFEEYVFDQEIYVSNCSELQFVLASSDKRNKLIE